MRRAIRRAPVLPLLAAALALSPVAAPAEEPWKTTPLPGALPAPVGEGRVQRSGASLHYATFGAGEPLVLLHGGAGNSEHWAFQIPALSQRYRVIVVDARGHGRSTRDDRPFAYHLMAEDLLAVMDALGLAKASIVGWSDGGIVGLDLAINHPERVRALVLFGANFDRSGLRKGGGPHATFASYIDRCAADYQRLSATPAAFKSFMAALRAMWSTQPTFTAKALRRIRTRTLVVDGERDEIMTQAHQRSMAELIPGARLLLIPGTSHFAHWQRPDLFNEAVLGFLGESR